MLQVNQTIVDQRGEQRWRLDKGPFRLPGDCPYLQWWEVEDLRLSRSLQWLCLSYQTIPGERLAWDVPALRKVFHQLVGALSPNHLCLPEPVDYLTFRRPDLEKELADGDPALVFAASGGQKLPSLQRVGQPQRLHLLRQLCLNMAYALRDLHQHGCLLRAFSLQSVRRNAASGAMVLTSFPYLCRTHDFRGFSRHEVGFHPPATHAAPECFVAEGQLSPASDVYALGRMLLEALGERLSVESYSPYELEEIGKRHELDETWLRFFKLALQPHPRERFDGMGEVIAYATSRGQTAGRKRTRGCGAPENAPQPRTERPDAPPAAILIWSERMLSRAQRFNYHAFLAHCQAHYSLRPLLFFTREQKDMNNPFFQVLRRLSFEIIPYLPHALPGQVVLDAQARWRDTSHLMVVGHASAEGCRLLLETARTTGASSEFFATGGESPAGLVSGDIQPFLEQSVSLESRRSSRSRQRSRRQRSKERSDV